MPFAFAIAALWMIGGLIVDHFLWHPSAAFTYDTIHNQYVQATESNSLYTFNGYIATGLTYNYYRDGFFSYFQERTGCLAIAEVDQPNADAGIGEARCVMSTGDVPNLTYAQGQAYLMECRELWPTHWPTTCALGKQDHKV